MIESRIMSVVKCKKRIHNHKHFYKKYSKQWDIYFYLASVDLCGKLNYEYEKYNKKGLDYNDNSK